MDKLLNTAILLSIISSYKSQVIPSEYAVAARGFEINGSSAAGHCNDFSGLHRVGGSVIQAACFTPHTSVLFDGEIPTLTGLDGNMWASQLLTMNAQPSSRLALVTSGIGRVEVVMFNCPEWEIGVSTIALESAAEVHPNVTSCEYLVKVCIACDDCTGDLPDLLFYPTDGSNWTHIAEVMLYSQADNITCPPDSIITTAPTLPPDATPTPPPDTTITTPAPPSDTTITTPPPDTTITTPTPPSDTTITTPPPDTTSTTPTPPSDTTITTPAPPPDTTITTPPDTPALSTTLSVVLSFLFILVCVVVVAHFLWRCYSLKQRTTEQKGEEFHLQQQKSSLHENPEMQLNSMVQNDAGSSKANILQQHDYEEVLSISEALKGTYASLTSQDLPSIYTQIQPKDKEPQDESRSAVYASITNPDPQNVYTQVNKTMCL